MTICLGMSCKRWSGIPPPLPIVGWVADRARTLALDLTNIQLTCVEGLLVHAHVNVSIYVKSPPQTPVGRGICDFRIRDEDHQPDSGSKEEHLRM